MELSNAIEQVNAGQKLLAILEQELQTANSLLKTSDTIHELLQLLFGSYTWRISRRLMMLMLRPFSLGFGPTILDEIDQELETFEQHRSQSKLGKELAASEECKEPEALITCRPNSDDVEQNLSLENYDTVSTEPALDFISK